MIKHTLAIVVFVIGFSILAVGQSTQQVTTAPQQTAAQLAAKTELNEAARAYKVGKFVEAQRHSERALELDPANRHAPVFIARSIQAQYRNGDEDPENVAIAHDAIAAYEKLLLINPEDEESFKAVLELYDAIGEIELQYSWLQQRANNTAVPTAKRVEAFVILANKDWNCCYKIEHSNENKQVEQTESGENVVVYKKPKQQTKFDSAQQCSTRGLEMAESAITLDSENYEAWSIKVYLLLEMAKLAEKEGNEGQRNEYRRLANEIHTDMDKLISNQGELEEAVSGKPNSVTSSKAGITSGSAPKWQLISKPLPPYPMIARTARAHGLVVVEITIDEEGKVISAKAVSGHPLLRAAAVIATRQAVFAPTIVDGHPTKVTGMLRYYFPLK